MFDIVRTFPARQEPQVYPAKHNQMPINHFLRGFCLALFALFSTAVCAQDESPAFDVTQLLPNNSITRAWDLHYGPSDWLWYTEREDGVVTRIKPETGQRDRLLKIEGVFSGTTQDGLLGMALHDGILGDNPYVYLSYTYQLNGDRRQRLVRYTYAITGDNGTLSDPMTLIENLPASNDHNSGRLIFGPDEKLYYTIGDQGNNQNRNYCDSIVSQVLPTQGEIDTLNWTNYPGKILRLNTDGSIPDDNPVFAGVQSHIFTNGHRNAQGIVFGSNGLLYSSEHGPDTDDEVNIITGGMNYGWPRVVGLRDDQAYDYCNWSSLDICAELDYTKNFCPPGATFLEESTFQEENYQEPLFPMFAVTDDYNFNDPRCQDSYTCRPNVAPSSIGIYESDAIPSWKNSLLVVSLKRGQVYRLQLDEAGTAVVGDTTRHFYTGNRYRDIVVSPDGKTFYLITDQSGPVTDLSGLNRRNGLRNPGTIMRFTLKPPVSATDPRLGNVFSIWPNPASENLSVELNTPDVRNARAELISANGQVVRAFANLNAGINQVNIGGLPAGVYTFRLYGRAGSWPRRLVVR